MKRSARNHSNQTLLAFLILAMQCQFALTLADPARANASETDKNQVGNQNQSVKPNQKPTAANSQSSASVNGPEPTIDPVKVAQLWLTMKWGKIGISTQANPVLSDVGLPPAQSQELVKRMMASADVQNRVNDWRQWYESVFAVVPKAVDEKPPAQRIRFGISVTVTKDRQIHAFSDFASGNEGDSSGTVYAGKIISALKSLDDQAILKFPQSSKQEQIKFHLQTDGFENVELQAIGNPLD